METLPIGIATDATCFFSDASGNNTVEENSWVIPAIGHTFANDFTEDMTPSCTKKGSKSRHCTNTDCKEKIDVTEIPMTDHNYGEWTVTKAETCTENGSKEKVCSGCDHKVTEVIDAKGHRFSDDFTVDKAPNCKEGGVESIHCLRCNTVKEESERTIPIIGHNYSSWKTSKVATEINAGKKFRKCSTCDKTETKSIAMLKPSLPSVTIIKPNVAKKSATIKWKKVSKKNQKRIGNIQIQYSLDKKFKKGVKTTTAKKTATSKKINKLASKKEFYVRIRAYKKVGGKIRVSKWSKVKTVKIK